LLGRNGPTFGTPAGTAPAGTETVTVIAPLPGRPRARPGWSAAATGLPPG
jgi:hypothetical protein